MEMILKDASFICLNYMEEIKLAIARIITMSFVKEYEGILALEIYAEEDDDYPEKRFVVRTMEYLSDGTDWNFVKHFLTNRICVMNDKKKQYLCLLYMECFSLFFMEDKRKYYQKDIICSLIPEEFQSEISAYIDERLDIEYSIWNEKKYKKIDEEFSKIKVLCPSDITEAMVYFEEIANFQPNSRFAQKWLLHMENDDVVDLLLIGSETFKESILSNMSTRLKYLIKEDAISKSKNWSIDYLEDLHYSIQKGMDVLNQL